MENYQLLLQPLNKIRAIPIVTCVSSYLFVLLFKFAGSPYLVTSIAAARAELLIAISVCGASVLNCCHAMGIL